MSLRREATVRWRFAIDHPKEEDLRHVGADPFALFFDERVRALHSLQRPHLRGNACRALCCSTHNQCDDQRG